MCDPDHTLKKQTLAFIQRRKKWCLLTQQKSEDQLFFLETSILQVFETLHDHFKRATFISFLA